MKIIGELDNHIDRSILKNKPIEHFVFYGPPGLGKTTLVKIIAQKLGVRVIEKIGRELTPEVLEESLLSLQYRDIFFIDEVHRTKIATRELLYAPMQLINNGHLKEMPRQVDFQGKGINSFSFAGATTKAGRLEKPLRDRIVLPYELESYTETELCQILSENNCPSIVRQIIARRSRGIPRVALNYWQRISVKGTSKKEAEVFFDRWGINQDGFTPNDFDILMYLKLNGPASARTLAISTRIDEEDFLNMHEPFLLEKGMINIGAKGRRITNAGLEYLQQTKYKTLDK